MGVCKSFFHLVGARITRFWSLRRKLLDCLRASISESEIEMEDDSSISKFLGSLTGPWSCRKGYQTEGAPYWEILET